MLASQLPVEEGNDCEVKELVLQIRLATSEAASLCQQLLLDDDEPLAESKTWVQIDQLLEEVRRFVDTTSVWGSLCHWEVDPDLPQLSGDRAQLKRIVINLLRNAVEAVQDEQGQVTIRAGVVEPEGSSVYIEVSDTGCGMDEQILRHLFHPSFTTKPTGHGLGLVSVREIVRAHDGTVEIESEPGRGTLVRVLLPVPSETVPREGPQTSVGRPKTEADWADKEDDQPRVLLVDDQRTYRVLGKRLMEKRGIQVTSVQTADDALRRLREDPSYDAMLLDLHLAESGGAEVLRQIRAAGLDLPVIITSGCTRSEMIADFTDELQPDAFIEKPFDLNVLASTLLSLLQRSDKRPRVGHVGNPLLSAGGESRQDVSAFI